MFSSELSTSPQDVQPLPGPHPIHYYYFAIMSEQKPSTETGQLQPLVSGTNPWNSTKTLSPAAISAATRRS